jgi:hypothetical protein
MNLIAQPVFLSFQVLSMGIKNSVASLGEIATINSGLDRYVILRN